LQNTPKLYLRYVPIKLLIAYKFRLLFTYNADSIRNLSSLGSLRRVSLFKLLHSTIYIINNRLDRPLKPGIRNNTLRIVLRFQSFNQYTYFCVFYLIMIIDRIVYIPFKYCFKIKKWLKSELVIYLIMLYSLM